MVYHKVVVFQIHLFFYEIMQKIVSLLLGLVNCRYGMAAGNASHIPPSTSIGLISQMRCIYFALLT
jgi:hypothetical protein